MHVEHYPLNNMYYQLLPCYEPYTCIYTLYPFGSKAYELGFGDLDIIT